MRITFVLPRATLSGGTRVVAIYARHLMARGHDVTVVSHKQHFPPLRKAWNRLKPAWMKKRKPRSTLLDFLGPRHIAVDQDMPESLNSVPDADIIVATWWSTATWVAGMPASKGRKFYLLQDYEMFDYTPHDEVAATYRMPLRKLAVSSYIRDEIRTHHGVEDVAVIPNSVDLEQFNASERPMNQSLTLGFLYTPNPRKRAHLAVDVAIAARKRWPGLQVVAFGSKAPANPEDMPDWISYHIAPGQQEIPRIYASCDVWLFPSEAEGFGLPILEAMACRTPVLAAPAGAAPDLIDEENGRLISGGVDEFLTEIERFVEMSEADWQLMSEAAWRRAHSYSWDDATDRLLSHFAKDQHPVTQN